MSTTTLSFMGVGEPETFRCRVYGSEETPEERHARHVREVREQAASAGGCAECPAYDAAIAELRDELRWEWRGVDGGRVKVWRVRR